MLSENAEQRELAAIIPQGGEDMGRHSVLSRWVVTHANDRIIGTDESRK